MKTMEQRRGMGLRMVMRYVDEVALRPILGVSLHGEVLQWA